MSAHTPGPWLYEIDDEHGDHDTRHAISGGPDELWIAQCFISGTSQDIDSPEADAEGIANARLIAAAPDMYDILTTIKAVILGGNKEQFDLILCVESPIRNAIYAAIAKATGASA